MESHSKHVKSLQNGKKTSTGEKNWTRQGALGGSLPVRTQENSPNIENPKCHLSTLEVTASISTWMLNRVAAACPSSAWVWLLKWAGGYRKPPVPALPWSAAATRTEPCYLNGFQAMQAVVQVLTPASHFLCSTDRLHFRTLLISWAP